MGNTSIFAMGLALLGFVMLVLQRMDVDVDPTANLPRTLRRRLTVAVPEAAILEGKGGDKITAVPVPEAISIPDKVIKGFNVTGDPKHISDLDEQKFKFSVTPYSQAITVASNDKYDKGTLQFKLQTASVMPGVITAVYLTTGGGRTSDVKTGDQDEVDFEFKGNEPSKVSSNVFVGGKEALEPIDLGYDSSVQEHLYAFEWNDITVDFYVDGAKRRTVPLSRPLKPMHLELSIWTTADAWDGLVAWADAWDGLVAWAGKTDWKAHNMQPAEATVEILQFPNVSKPESHHHHHHHHPRHHPQHRRHHRHHPAPAPAPQEQQQQPPSQQNQQNKPPQNVDDQGQQNQQEVAQIDRNAGNGGHP